MKLKISATALLIGSSLLPTAFCQAEINSFDINLSEHAVEGTLDIGGPWQNTHQSISVQYNDDLDRDEDGYTLAYGLYSGGAKGEISGSLGGKAMLIDADIVDGGALALGGEFRWYFHPEISLQVRGHLAPSVLSFGDVDRYRELGVHVAFDLIPNTHIYVGVKTAEAKFEGFKRDAEFQDGINIGFEMKLQ
ncbi:YfaZ family outer membrane protein [Aurantivibrio plasticivorans]